MNKLKHLSLVSNICNELETHVVAVAPKDLAEYIIDLGRNSETADELDKKLKKDDAELPDYFVRSLLTEIEREAQREEDRDDRRDRHRHRGGRSRGDRYRRGRSRGRGGANEPELYQVYKGRVTRVMESGCFVQFDRFRGKEGLVHVSQMGAESLVKKRDMQVYVKVLSVKEGGAKYSLSMKDVDQNTGRDYSDSARRSNPSFRTKDTKSGISGIRILEEERPSRRRPLKKKMSSPERWEAKQIIASGALKATDFPDYYDEDGVGMLYQEEGAEQEFEIEMNEEEPAFLQGQTRCSADMSPVKIFRNPQGSLSRAAALQSALTKERREMGDQQQRTILDSIPKDLNRPWEDPMPETGERHLAQELRGVGLSAYDMPEWKKDAFGKTPTFGQRSKLSIQEQRESLPIYKLKTELIQAVHDNQVLVQVTLPKERLGARSLVGHRQRRELGVLVVLVLGNVTVSTRRAHTVMRCLLHQSLKSRGLT
ncbi:BnaC03g67040D [Brassica napus]|uniref:BnaC03g67040D protein n=1 Tax=Brassica napus TaxID=3708 RepID=A0A078IKT8_BRANA|nr:BnaC03g67040D [Brassica napus]